MRRARVLQGLGLVLLLVLISSRDASACTCITPGPACQTYWTTDAVFDGTVTAIAPIERTETIGGRDYRMPEYAVRFDVRQAWKGVEGAQLEILTGSGGMCGFDFKVGGRYLVFAHRRGTDGKFGASICSLTRAYDGFDSDITPFLASLAAPPPDGGRVSGSVSAGSGRFSQGKSEPLDVQVRLTGTGRTVVTTSAAGRYEFTNLKPAQYEIDVTLPQGYSSPGFPRTVSISDPRACARQDVWVRPTGMIIGRLAGPTGPAGSVLVEIAPADVTLSEHGEWPSSTTRTLPDGTFEASEIPPGRYLVGINLRGTPTPSNRYERLILQNGAPDREGIAVALGQSVDLGTLQIPAPIRVIKVTGVVTRQDGSPVANFDVFAHESTVAGRFVAAARTGADGRFTMELMDGRTYMLRGPATRDGRIELPLVLFKVGEGMAPIGVVTPRVPPGPSR